MTAKLTPDARQAKASEYLLAAQKVLAEAMKRQGRVVQQAESSQQTGLVPVIPPSR